MASPLSVGEEQQQNQPLDRLTLGRLFESVEGWDSVLGPDAAREVDDIVYGSTDAVGDRQRIANHAFLADAFKVSPEKIAEAPQQYMDSWAAQVLGEDKAGLDDAGFYSHVGTFLKGQQEEGAMLQRQAPDMVRAFGRGEDFYEAFEALMPSWSAQAPWNQGKVDAYREWHKQAWFAYEDFTNQYTPELNAVRDFLKAAKKPEDASRIKGQDVAGLRDKAIEGMMRLPLDVQQQLVTFAQAGVEEAPGEERGGVEKAAFRVGRATVDMLKGMGRFAQDVAYAGAAPAIRLPVSSANATARLLDDAMRGVDPARGTNAFTESFLGASENLPYILSFATPVGVAAQVSASGDLLAGEFESRGIPTEQAVIMAGLAAPAYVGIERLQATMILKGALPGASKLLRGGGTAREIARNAALRIGGGLLEQYGQEVAQDLIAPTTQTLAAAFSQAVPEVDWTEEFRAIGEAAPETLATLAWLSVVGAGVGTFRDRAQGQALLQRRVDYLAMGFAPETVDKILDAKSPEDAELIIQLEWANRKMGTNDQVDAVEALNEAVSMLPRDYSIRQSDEHGWVAYNPRGIAVGSAASPEMAGVLALEDQARRSLEVDARRAAIEEGAALVEEQEAEERAFLQSREALDLLNEQLATERDEAAQAQIRERIAAEQQRLMAQEEQRAARMQREAETQAAFAPFAPIFEAEEAKAARREARVDQEVSRTIRRQMKQIRERRMAQSVAQAAKLREQLRKIVAKQAEGKPGTQQELEMQRELERQLTLEVDVIVRTADAVIQEELAGPQMEAPESEVVSAAEIAQSLPVPEGMEAAEAARIYREIESIDRQLQKWETTIENVIDKRRQGARVRRLNAEIRELREKRLTLQAELGDPVAQDVLARFQEQEAAEQDQPLPVELLVWEWLMQNKLPSPSAVRKAGGKLAGEIKDLELPIGFTSSSQTAELDKLGMSLAEELADQGDAEARAIVESGTAPREDWIIDKVGEAWAYVQKHGTKRAPLAVPFVQLATELIRRAEQWSNDVLEERATGALNTLDPQLMAALTVRGAFVIGRGVRDFAKWSAEMASVVGDQLAESLPVIYEASKRWAARHARVEALGKRFLVMEGVGPAVEQFQVWLPGDTGRGVTMTADQMQAEGIPTQVAPATPAGEQPGLPVSMAGGIAARLEAGGMEAGEAAEQAARVTQPQALFNLTQDIAGHPAGSTVTETTLQKKGMAAPGGKGIIAGSGMEAWADEVIAGKLDAAGIDVGAAGGSVREDGDAGEVSSGQGQTGSTQGPVGGSETRQRPVGELVSEIERGTFDAEQARALIAKRRRLIAEGPLAARTEAYTGKKLAKETDEEFAERVFQETEISNKSEESALLDAIEAFDAGEKFVWPETIDAGRARALKTEALKPSERMKEGAGAGYGISGSRLGKWADRIIKENQGRTFALPVHVQLAFAVKGAAIIERGIRDFAKWSAEMIKTYGSGIRPHLQAIYDQALAMVKAVPEAKTQWPPQAAVTITMAPVSNQMKARLSRNLTESLPDTVKRMASLFQRPSRMAGFTRHPVGREWMGRIQAATTDAGMWAGQWLSALERAEQDLTHADKKWARENFKKAYEEGAAMPNERLQGFADAWSAIHNSVADQAEAMGVEVADEAAPGGRRPFQRITNYYPWTFTKTAMQALRRGKGQVYDAIVAAAIKRGIDPRGLIEELDQEMHVRRNGHLEITRGEALPETVTTIAGEVVQLRTKDPFADLENHVMAAAQRLSIIRHFGSAEGTGQTEARKVTDAASRQLKADGYAIEGRVLDGMWAVMNGNYQAADLKWMQEHGLGTIVPVIENIARTAQLSLATLSQVTMGWVPIMARVGIINTIRQAARLRLGMTKLAMSAKTQAELDIVRNMGAWAQHVLGQTYSTEDFVGTSRVASTAVLGVLGFNFSNRVLNQIGSLAAVQAMGESIGELREKDNAATRRMLAKNFDFTDEQIERMVADGIDYSDIETIAAKASTDAAFQEAYRNLAQAAQRTTAKTNLFREPVTERPPWMNKRVARMFMAYLSAVRAMGNTFADSLSEARNGNVGPLVTLVVAGTLAGAARETLGDILYRRDDEPDESQFAFLKKLLGWQLEAGVYGLVGSYSEDFFWSVKRGEVVPLNVPLFEWWGKNVVGAGKAIEEGSISPAYEAIVRGTPLFRAIDAQLQGPFYQKQRKNKKRPGRTRKEKAPARESNPDPFAS